jgi:histone-lysine N-methyltransferase SETMAR
MQWKHPNSPSRSKKKIKVSPWAEKVMLTVFCDSQGVLLAHFQKCENMKSASYCEVLLKLRVAIHRRPPSQLARGVLLHHDNARLHSARPTQERIQGLQWELLEHPPYSPELASSDIHLFGHLKKPPWWQTFRWWRRGWIGGAEVAKTTVENFYSACFEALVKR